eukprot:TRINITY_DN72139_c0_g1_i1.p1 TRINITY_DN72139_c0_g1~~TRINITY_DN72139_c0_g1_i1.p1  ORF type:complete len:399 (-),score=19.48 TRINITY_DN72139_c0_g1_i1:27-1223(-)
MNFWCCVGYQQAESRQILRKDVDQVLQAITDLYNAGDVLSIPSKFSSPCTCIFECDGESHGGVHRARADVACFFRQLRNQLACPQMTFLVEDLQIGLQHEYFWESTYCVGSARVCWQYNDRHRWQIVYLKISAYTREDVGDVPTANYLEHRFLGFLKNISEQNIDETCDDTLTDDAVLTMTDESGVPTIFEGISAIKDLYREIHCFVRFADMAIIDFAVERNHSIVQWARNNTFGLAHHTWTADNHGRWRVCHFEVVRYESEFDALPDSVLESFINISDLDVFAGDCAHTSALIDFFATPCLVMMCRDDGDGWDCSFVTGRIAANQYHGCNNSSANVTREIVSVKDNMTEESWYRNSAAGTSTATWLKNDMGKWSIVAIRVSVIPMLDYEQNTLGSRL